VSKVSLIQDGKVWERPEGRLKIDCFIAARRGDIGGGWLSGWLDGWMDAEKGGPKVVQN